MFAHASVEKKKNLKRFNLDFVPATLFKKLKDTTHLTLRGKTEGEAQELESRWRTESRRFQ